MMQNFSNCKRLYARDLGRAVDLFDSDELITGFSSILRGWNVEVKQGPSPRPDMIFLKRRKTYDWRVPDKLGHDDAAKGWADSVCSAVGYIHSEACDWYRAVNSDHLCLHAAAVGFGKSTVLFPNTHYAGKSTLAVALAAIGGKVFGDDVVAIDTATHELVSLGMLPRLRLPFRRALLDRATAEFISKRRGLADKQYLYVNLEESHHGILGERTALNNIVILDRSEVYLPARLIPTGAGEVIRTILKQNMRTNIPAEKRYFCLKEIITNASCFRLKYYDLPGAVSVLQKAFAQ